MDIIQIITKELSVEKWQVEAAVKLIDEGCTIPFISRYRKVQSCGSGIAGYNIFKSVVGEDSAYPLCIFNFW